MDLGLVTLLFSATALRGVPICNTRPRPTLGPIRLRLFHVVEDSWACPHPEQCLGVVPVIAGPAVAVTLSLDDTGNRNVLALFLVDDVSRVPRVGFDAGS